MIKDVEAIVNRFSAIDEPVPYKGLSIYPIKVREYYNFGVSYDILCIEKNDIPDIEIIQMSYLEFLYKKMFQDETIIDKKENLTAAMFNMSKFYTVLSLCLKVDFKDIECVEVEHKPKVIISGIEFDSKEFDEIRKIILHQNIHDYCDDYIDPDMRKAIDEYYSIKNRDLVMPELEDEMASLTAMTGVCKKDILDMTYREYKKVFHAALDRMDYQMAKTAELSGNVKFDKPIDHWVYKRKKNRYEDAFTSADGVKNKVSSV